MNCPDLRHFAWTVAASLAAPQLVSKPSLGFESAAHLPPPERVFSSEMGGLAGIPGFGHALAGSRLWCTFSAGPRPSTGTRFHLLRPQPRPSSIKHSDQPPPTTQIWCRQDSNAFVRECVPAPTDMPFTFRAGARRRASTGEDQSR